MQYTGWAWDTGEKFDSSWDRGAPFSFVQGQGMVITGWDQHLLDLPVGSQVMLVIPPVDAYGEDPAQHQLGGKTLVFVVDVLDAAHRID
ncbi:FKBP-type peptidyl-prolyl cis-trans isomerase [Brachybacterium muris]|nr:FKBP-type peptidyl-prolyl cis-trans isomerase [Brachybacterium muris]